MQRWISGIILASLAALLLVFGGVLLLSIVVVCLSGVLLNEIFNLLLPHLKKSFRIIGIVYGMILVTVSIGIPQFQGLVLFVGLVLTNLLYFSDSRPFNERVNDLCRFTFSWCVVGLLVPYWIWIRQLEPWAFWTLLLLVNTFFADTGAYLAGHLLGRHKLAPDLSPGKTIEGLVGGTFLSIAGGVGVQHFFNPTFSLVSVIGLAVVVSLVGPIGDLSESMIKRGAGVKDSGSLIPGHGGIFDRVDALLFAGPIVYYWAKLFS